MIFLSFLVCLAAIFNRYLPQMFPAVENITAIQETIATYINLVSGVVLVLGIVLGFYVARMHTEGTALQDRFEAYVFDNAANRSILRPIPQNIVEIYAKKTRRKDDEQFKNAIYAAGDKPNAATAQFDYISKEVRSDYKLYIYIQPFFLTIWIGFCILVIIIAVSFNDAFITTLINILIPSLSAISTIASSWRGCRLQIRQLQNLINIIDEIQAMPESKRTAYITDKHNVRLLADGLFEYRVSPFVIPRFLVRRYQKSAKAEYGAKHVQTAEEEAAATTATGSSGSTVKPSATQAPAAISSSFAHTTGATVKKSVKKLDEKPVEKPHKSARTNKHTPAGMPAVTANNHTPAAKAPARKTVKVTAKPTAKAELEKSTRKK